MHPLVKCTFTAHRKINPPVVGVRSLIEPVASSKAAPGPCSGLKADLEESQNSSRGIVHAADEVSEAIALVERLNRLPALAGRERWQLASKIRMCCEPHGPMATRAGSRSEVCVQLKLDVPRVCLRHAV